MNAMQAYTLANKILCLLSCHTLRCCSHRLVDASKLLS